MKITNQRAELQNLSEIELQKKIVDLRKQLFTLRMNVVTAQIKDYSQFSLLKRSIARGLTYLRQKK